MTRLFYLANNRLPTEKAHGLQIVQMCEAFAETGCEVTLVTARRTNTCQNRDIWSHYGVTRSFAFQRLPSLDLIDLTPLRWQIIPFTIQTLTYLIALSIWLLSRRADVYYTRDWLIGLLLTIIRPRARLVYEVHQKHHSGFGCWVERRLAHRARLVPVTGHLADQMRTLGAQRVLVEHDGVRLARFAHLPDRPTARASLNIPTDVFIIGYVGRLQTMGMAKGLDTLIDGIAQAEADCYLLLVGGPEAGVQLLREQWAARGLPADHLIAAGQVEPDAVPLYMAAMDVGAMPLPWTEHFAYYASALKLFEYMAAGCAVLASDLPSTAEVVRDGESALLVPPGNVGAFAQAVRRLYTDRELCIRLGKQAQIDVQHYAWTARAARISAFFEDRS